MKPSVQENLDHIGTGEFGNWNMESNSEGIDFDCEFLKDITEEY